CRAPARPSLRRAPRTDGALPRPPPRRARPVRVRRRAAPRPAPHPPATGLAAPALPPAAPRGRPAARAPGPAARRGERARLHAPRGPRAARRAGLPPPPSGPAAARPARSPRLPRAGRGRRHARRRPSTRLLRAPAGGPAPPRRPLPRTRPRPRRARRACAPASSRHRPGAPPPLAPPARALPARRGARAAPRVAPGGADEVGQRPDYRVAELLPCLEQRLGRGGKPHALPLQLGEGVVPRRHLREGLLGLAPCGATMGLLLLELGHAPPRLLQA